MNYEEHCLGLQGTRQIKINKLKYFKARVQADFPWILLYKHPIFISFSPSSLYWSIPRSLLYASFNLLPSRLQLYKAHSPQTAMAPNSVFLKVSKKPLNSI